MYEESLFHLALDKPAGERVAFLDAACGGDTALRQRPEVLLRAYQEPGSFLGNPAFSPQATVGSRPGRDTGSRDACASSSEAPDPGPTAERPGSRKAANGDTVGYCYEANRVGPDRWVGNFAIGGGTGRFAAASGGGVMVIENRDPGFVVTLDGTISY